jgi:hypothetical protein
MTSFWLAPANSRSNIRIVRASAWTIATVAGFLKAWAARFSLSPDATNYLDLASAYLRHDWHNAINAYWSPLFSWLLALVLAVFRPSVYTESTALHLLNFVGLPASLFQPRSGTSEPEWLLLGHTCFSARPLPLVDTSLPVQRP